MAHDEFGRAGGVQLVRPPLVVENDSLADSAQLGSEKTVRQPAEDGARVLTRAVWEVQFDIAFGPLAP